MRAVCTVREFSGRGVGPAQADRGVGEVEARLAVK